MKNYLKLLLCFIFFLFFKSIYANQTEKLKVYSVFDEKNQKICTKVIYLIFYPSSKELQFDYFYIKDRENYFGINAKIDLEKALAKEKRQSFSHEAIGDYYSSRIERSKFIPEEEGIEIYEGKRKIFLNDKGKCIEEEFLIKDGNIIMKNNGNEIKNLEFFKYLIEKNSNFLSYFMIIPKENRDAFDPAFLKAFQKNKISKKLNFKANYRVIEEEKIDEQLKEIIFSPCWKKINNFF